LGFIRLQVQDDLIFEVIDDRPSILAVFKTEEIGKVLRGGNRTASKASDDLEYLKAKFRRLPVGAGANQLPDFINEDCL